MDEKRMAAAKRGRGEGQGSKDKAGKQGQARQGSGREVKPKGSMKACRQHESMPMGCRREARPKAWIA